MKKSLIFLDIIFIFLLSVLFCTRSLNQILVNTISTGVIGETVTHRVVDVLQDKYPSLDTSAIYKVQEAFGESQTVNDIADEYYESIMEAMTTGHDIEFPNIGYNMNRLIDENIEVISDELGIQVSQIQKNQLQSEVKKRSDEVQSILESTANQYIHNESLPLSKALSVYQSLQSTSFQTMLVITLIIVGILIVFRAHSLASSLQHIGMSSVIVGFVLCIVIPFCVTYISDKVAMMILGQNLNLDFSSLSQNGIIALFVGIICFIFGKIMKTKTVV